MGPDVRVACPLSYRGTKTRETRSNTFLGHKFTGIDDSVGAPTTRSTTREDWSIPSDVARQSSLHANLRFCEENFTNQTAPYVLTLSSTCRVVVHVS